MYPSDYCLIIPIKRKKSVDWGDLRPDVREEEYIADGYEGVPPADSVVNNSNEALFSYVCIITYKFSFVNNKFIKIASFLSYPQNAKFYLRG